MSRKWTPPGTPKSIKNHEKSIPAPPSDLLAAPGGPWMRQMVIQGAKMIHKSIKNGIPNTYLEGGPAAEA